MIECLIDTDTLSYFLKGDKNVTINVEEYLRFSGFDRLTISVITVYEVLAGLEYKQAVKQIENFEKFIAKSKIVPLSDESLRISAMNYGIFRRKGIIIGTPDLLIAGIAQANNFSLVTNNVKHYEKIENLIIHNWKENS